MFKYNYFVIIFMTISKQKIEDKFMVRAGNTVQLNVSIPKKLMKQLKELAKKEDRSLSNLVGVWLKKTIKKEV